MGGFSHPKNRSVFGSTGPSTETQHRQGLAGASAAGATSERRVHCSKIMAALRQRHDRGLEVFESGGCTVVAPQQRRQCLTGCCTMGVSGRGLCSGNATTTVAAQRRRRNYGRTAAVPVQRRWRQRRFCYGGGCTARAGTATTAAQRRRQNMGKAAAVSWLRRRQPWRLHCGGGCTAMAPERRLCSHGGGASAVGLVASAEQWPRIRSAIVSADSLRWWRRLRSNGVRKQQRRSGDIRAVLRHGHYSGGGVDVGGVRSCGFTTRTPQQRQQNQAGCSAKAPGSWLCISMATGMAVLHHHAAASQQRRQCKVWKATVQRHHHRNGGGAAAAPKAGAQRWRLACIKAQERRLYGVSATGEIAERELHSGCVRATLQQHHCVGGGGVQDSGYTTTAPHQRHRCQSPGFTAAASQRWLHRWHRQGGIPMVRCGGVLMPTTWWRCHRDRETPLLASSQIQRRLHGGGITAPAAGAYRWRSVHVGTGSVVQHHRARWHSCLAAVACGGAPTPCRRHRGGGKAPLAAWPVHRRGDYTSVLAVMVQRRLVMAVQVQRRSTSRGTAWMRQRISGVAPEARHACRLGHGGSSVAKSTMALGRWHGGHSMRRRTNTDGRGCWHRVGAVVASSLPPGWLQSAGVGDSGLQTVGGSGVGSTAIAAARHQCGSTAAAHYQRRHGTIATAPTALLRWAMPARRRCLGSINGTRGMVAMSQARGAVAASVVMVEHRHRCGSTAAAQNQRQRVTITTAPAAQFRWAGPTRQQHVGGVVAPTAPVARLQSRRCRALWRHRLWWWRIGGFQWRLLLDCFWGATAAANFHGDGSGGGCCWAVFSAGGVAAVAKQRRYSTATAVRGGGVTALMAHAWLHRRGTAAGTVATAKVRHYVGFGQWWCHISSSTALAALSTIQRSRGRGIAVMGWEAVAQWLLQIRYHN